MPENYLYYPAMSDLIDVTDVPESLEFIQEGIQQIFDNVYYKDFISSINVDGNGAFYSLAVVSRKKIAFELFGSGLSVILNPDYDDATISSFPVTLFWEWQILRTIRNFNISNFSFTPEAFFDFGIKILNVCKEQVLKLAIATFVTPVYPVVSSFEQLISDINSLYGLSIIINEDDEDKFDQLIAQMEQLDKSVFTTIFTLYILFGDLQTTRENLDYFFSTFIPSGLESYIKDLFIPKLRTTLTLKTAIEFPRSVFVPMKQTPDGIVPDDTLDAGGHLKKSIFKFAEAQFFFDTNGGFGSDIELAGSLIPEFNQIGNTGLTIGFTGAKLDLSRTTNIPEADAAGYPVDFMGLYVKHATIGFNRFGENDPNHVSARITADNLFIGTGGVSGKIALESDGLLYRRFGNFAVELEAFSISFRQNAIINSDIKGRLTIGGFKQGTEAAVIDIQAHIYENGDFSITALPQDNLLTITLPNVLEIIIGSIELGKEERGFYIEVAGQLNFIADIPVLGDVLPKGIEIKKLRIWDNGDLEFKGGGLVVPKSFRLKVGPVKLEVTNISIGATQRIHKDINRRHRFFGFDGMINTGRAGVNATGNGIKFYYTSDNNETDKPFHSFISIDGIAIDMTIPGNASKDNAAFILNGYLSVNTPGPEISGSNAGSEYSGAISFSMPRLKLAGSAGICLNPDTPAFVVDIGLELSTPIPLGATGLGIYGFRGLIGQY